MKVFLLLIVILIVLALVVFWRRGAAGREQRRLDDARAEAQRWYERLGGQVLNLHADDAAARQALADASERYNAAGSQLQQARTMRQFELARESGLEGLAYVRAGRLVLHAGVEDRTRCGRGRAGRDADLRRAAVPGLRRHGVRRRVRRRVPGR